MIKKIDKKNKFVSVFDPSSGFYARSGIIERKEPEIDPFNDCEEIITNPNLVFQNNILSILQISKFLQKGPIQKGIETDKEPFMASFPELLDIGIMKTCVCAHKCNVDCYQKAISNSGNNMSVRNFEYILKQTKGRMFQVALGGAGDPDTHENFEEILSLCKDYHVVPNFTTSGILMTKEKAELCKKYCGAVAVSEHFAKYTDEAIEHLLEADVKTNIHYVLSKKTIDRAIELLKTNSFRAGINAVIFLLYKPVGLGKDEYVLNPDDDKVKEFFSLIDSGKFHHKIGFDSCSCSGIVNHTKHILNESLDFCEGGRFSAYIDADMNMMPCSFANQDRRWYMSLREYTIEEVWNSDIFDKFRYSLSHSCPNCKNRDMCAGGCPLINRITLCNRSERKFAPNGLEL